MQSSPRYSLYHFQSCPYCWRVRREIDALGAPVELRDIDLDPARERELMAARGRRTVPVLRIDHADGRSEWMPESGDIVKYLRRTFEQRS